MPRFSTHALKFPEHTYTDYYGGFEPIEFITQGSKRLELAFSVNNNAHTSIVDLTMTIGGGYLQAEATPIAIESVSGNATLSGNVIAFTNGLDTMQAAAVILDPPPWLQLQLEAATFPSSPNGSSVNMWASWR
jgi:hypothetical protein